VIGRGIGIRTLLGFGIGGLTTGLVVTAPSILLLIYYTDTLRIPAGAAGIALFIPKILDVFLDPVMGTKSDRTSSRWGARHPYLFAGSLLIALSLMFLFATPYFDSWELRLAYATIWYFVLQIAMTVYIVPYLSLPAELTTDPDDQTLLMTCRAGFSFMGILVGSSAAPLLPIYFGRGTQGFAMMGVVIGLICGLAALVSTFATYKAVRSNPIVSDHSWPWSLLKENRAFALFLCAYGLYMMAIGCSWAGIPYLADRILHRPDSTADLFLALNLPALLAIPLWYWLARRFGKRSAFILSLFVVGCGTLLLAGANGQSSQIDMVWRLVVTGIGFAGTQVACWALLPEIVQRHAKAMGTSRSGAFTGLMTAMEKVGFALGALVAGMSLSFTGYSLTAETALSRLGILVAVGILPGAIMLLAALLMTRFPKWQKA